MANEELMFFPPEGSNVQKPSRAQVGLVNRITAMLQAYRRDVDMPEDLVVPDEQEVLSREGRRRVDRGAVIQFLNINPSYHQGVRDCRRLRETNPIFAAISRKLTRTIAEAPTRVEFEGGPRAKQAAQIIRAMQVRTQWDEKKENFIRNMLDEGGLTVEIVVSSARRGVDRLEYRPHDTIVPRTDDQGTFRDPNFAYKQVDPVGRVLAEFALWQLVDVNLEESSFHDRGVPHLMAARQLLEYVNVMSKGLMQKWVRESGSIEHFNLEDAKKWEDIEQFKERNQDTLNAAPDNLIRQFFTRGKMKIERIFADARAHQTNSIEFMMELIFLCAGVSKELLGFKSHVIIRDMIDLQIDNYYQNLNRIQSRLFSAYRKIVDFELLLNGIIPEEVPYRIVGGRFDVTRQVRIPKEAIETGAVSLNDIRRSCNLAPVHNPLWDMPGVYNSPEMALRMAQMSGIDLPTDDPGDLQVRRLGAVGPGLKELQGAEEVLTPKVGRPATKDPTRPNRTNRTARTRS